MKKFIAGMLIGAVISGGSAYAGRLITSKDIKNRTLKFEDLSGSVVDTSTLMGVFSGSGPAMDAWTPPNGGQAYADPSAATHLSPSLSLSAGDWVAEWTPENAVEGTRVTVTLYV